MLYYYNLILNITFLILPHTNHVRNPLIIPLSPSNETPPIGRIQRRQNKPCNPLHLRQIRRSTQSPNRRHRYP